MFMCSRKMFGYFRVTLIFNSVYVYGTRCSIALLTVLDVEQDILRLPTFHCMPQRGWSFKIEEKIDLKKLHHFERTAPY